MNCACGCGKDVAEHDGRGRPGKYATRECADRMRKRAQRERQKANNRDIHATPYDVTEITNTILHGDSLAVLKQLPDRCVQCCVTSPPYYNLRDYGVDGQIGLEASPAAYIAKLVEVFREVRRVLRNDGTLWLNIGDSYSNDRKWGGHSSGKHRKELHSMKRPRRYTGLPGKNLLMIPARLAIALQDDDWILRSDIIWHKPSAMPESITDRPTNDHEHVFLFARSERYYYDQDAIREPHVTTSNIRDRAGESAWASKALLTPIGEGIREWNHPAGRNKRSVWTIAAQPYADAHFATMPPKLVEPCILAGSRPGDLVLDPFFGAGTVGLVALQQGRNYLGIELNAEYIRLAEKRLEVVQPVLFSAG